MIVVRRAEERGAEKLGWLDSRHTFSFGNYYDPSHMGFGPLRVINEDRVRPGAGFGTHGHRDMEIISYVLEGAMEHKDSLGTGSVIRPGDVQVMSAGTGIRHSEFNHSPRDILHFLQIWIEPDEAGLTPGYGQQSFSTAERSGRLRLIASGDGREGSVRIHRDAAIHAALLDLGQAVEHAMAEGRRAWVQVARGDVDVDGEVLRAGDGAAVQGQARLRLAARADGTEILLFDLPP